MPPNGLRLSGARKALRCSRGLGGADFMLSCISLKSGTRIANRDDFGEIDRQKAGDATM